MTLWQIDENEELSVPTGEAPVAKASAVATSTTETSTTEVPAEEHLAELEKVLSANVEHNTQEPTMSVRSASMSESPTQAKKALAGPPASVALPEEIEEHQSVVPGLEAALANAEPAPVSAEQVDARKEEAASPFAETGHSGALEGGGVSLQEPKDAHEDAAIVNE